MRRKLLLLPFNNLRMDLSLRALIDRFVEADLRGRQRIKSVSALIFLLSERALEVKLIIRVLVNSL